MRYELSDHEWVMPNKPRGVRRVNNRRVLKAQVLESQSRL
jgi:hypothetical protein